ncbi:MAG: SDR family NAD(P)-dependent oxidoreductase [Alphaproteobacteria bacterium]|nr:SDR family NAD(P)-dependent oxidoreductase [Alphaproteobacteria bacterium]
MYSLGNKFKKALVTGGAGFIGSHIVEDLLGDGLEVISIDNYSAGKKENLAHLINWGQKFKEIKADVRDYKNLRPYLEGVDIVFHQAVSKNTICFKDPASDLEINALGTLNVLTAAREAGVKKFVHASTGSVYGDTRYYPSDEEHPLNPNSFYGVSKLAAEKYVRAFHHLYGMNVNILRYYHVFGPRQDYSDVGGVVSIFGRRAFQNLPLTIYGDGTQLRSFTFVKDVVNANKFLALTDDVSGEAFNCASGVKVTIKELADAILKYFGKETLPIEFQDWKPGDIKYFNVSHQKIADLGFKFQTSFEEGLANTLEWIIGYLESMKKYA